MNRLAASSAVVMAVGALLAGCGGSSSSSSSAVSTTTQQPTTGQASGAATDGATTPAPLASASSSTVHKLQTYASSTPPTPPPPSGSNQGTVLSLEANPNGRPIFNTKSLTAKPGRVTIKFRNMSSEGQGLALESSSGHRLGQTATFRYGTQVLSLVLKAGTYKFFSSVPGDRSTTEGTLTVGKGAPSLAPAPGTVDSRITATANTICATRNHELSEVPIMNLSLPALAKAAHRRAVIEQRTLAELKRLKRLKPTGEFAASYTKLLIYSQAAWRQVVKVYKRARAGDAAGARQAKDELEAEDFHPLAAAVNAHLEYCATTDRTIGSTFPRSKSGK